MYKRFTSNKSYRFIGGKEHIADVDACMTRLRVTVKDFDVVAPEAQWKQNGAPRLIVKIRCTSGIWSES